MRKLKHKEAAPTLPGVHNLWVSLVGSELRSPSLAVPAFNTLSYSLCSVYFSFALKSSLFMKHYANYLWEHEK